MATTYVPFNLIDWMQSNKNTITDLPVGDLYEHRNGYPAAKILLDSSPPTGDVVINDNRTSGGIKIHEFLILDINGAVVSPIEYAIQDRYGSYLSVVDYSTIGQETEPSKYQLIGYNDNQSLVALFTGTETIVKLQIGATSTKSKNYFIEIQVVGSDLWLPVLSMISSQETGEFYQYEFTNGITGVQAIRLRYRGDYYSSSNTNNNITLAASDKLTNVVAAQISHYADFSDSTDFPGNTAGWIDISEGTTSYTWDLINSSKIWSQQPGTVSAHLNLLFKLNNNLVALGDTSTYTVSYSNSAYGNVTLGYTFGSSINCATIHNNKIYVGLSDGKIYKSADGIVFSTSCDITGGKPVTALMSYQNSLFVGTDETSNAKVYSWNDTTATLVKTLATPTVTVFASAKGSLYVGTKGVASSKAGYVYRFNGQSTWTLSFDSLNDEIQALVYSPVNDRLWCGVDDGKIYLASFDTNNNPTWNRAAFYENDSTAFYGMTTVPTKTTPSTIHEAPINNYVWICSDTEVTAYVYSAMKKEVQSGNQMVVTDIGEIKFESIQFPTAFPIKSIAYFNNDLFGVSADGKLYKYDLSTISSTSKNVYVRLKDAAGNISALPSITNYEYIYDSIVQDVDKDASGIRVSEGCIYQVKYNPGDVSDKSIVSSFVASSDGAILSADRRVLSSGFYISSPFYVANLTSWDTINLLYNFPACDAPSDIGLNAGVKIDLYVKTANTRTLLSTTEWGTPFTETVIGSVSTTAQSSVSSSFQINALQGRWLQFYAVISTASLNKTPELFNISLFYKASGSSYFFTSMIDTSKQLANYRNYITNSDFESGIWPWEVTGAQLSLTTVSGDTGRLGVIQRTGGASPSSSVTSNPTDFLIESVYSGKQFMVSFYYKTSANYDDDMSVKIINTTKSTSTEATIVSSEDGEIFTTYFTVDTTSTADSYSLVFVLNSGTADFDMTIDDVYVGPDYGILAVDSPPFYRGLLTANTTVANGNVVFAYTTTDGDGTFDFNNNYTEIIPNTVFQLEPPSSKIRFGILFTKTGTDPVIVHDFAVQLEAHDTDMRLMDIPKL